jgi:hypothetical protein
VEWLTLLEEGFQQTRHSRVNAKNVNSNVIAFPVKAEKTMAAAA